MLTDKALSGERHAMLLEAELPEALISAIRQGYRALCARLGRRDAAVAVRSSATAEDLPDASFAGQQETFLNVRGLDNIMLAIKDVFASLFNDRAISYRVHKGFEHSQVALSAGIQRMVRSDTGASGVMFTIDTESGFDQVVFITSSWGLGEAVVQGAVNPDEFYVYKPNVDAKRPAILRRVNGGKAVKMVYTADRSHGKTTEFVDVDAAASGTRRVVRHPARRHREIHVGHVNRSGYLALASGDRDVREGHGVVSGGVAAIPRADRPASERRRALEPRVDHAKARARRAHAAPVPRRRAVPEQTVRDVERAGEDGDASAFERGCVALERGAVADPQRPARGVHPGAGVRGAVPDHAPHEV